MIDALLFSVRDEIRAAGFGWDARTCDIMGDQGQPPPRMGDWFCAVRQGPARSDMLNALDEYLDFHVTLTRRLSGVPLDVLGNKILAQQLARTAARETGFNARADQLKNLLHMDWGLLQAANTFMVNLSPNAQKVYGFCEPAHYAGRDEPHLVGPDWFFAEPDDLQVGLVGTLDFAGARRLQAIGSYT